MLELDELDWLVGKVVHVVETFHATYFRRVEIETELFDAVTWLGEEYQWRERGRFFVSPFRDSAESGGYGNLEPATGGAFSLLAPGGTSPPSEVWMGTWREDWPPVGVPEGRPCDVPPVVLFSFSAGAASDT